MNGRSTALWRCVVAAVVLMSALGVVSSPWVAAVERDRQDATGGRLEGADVVRGRSLADRVPAVRNVQTKIIQGQRVKKGVCDISFEFRESFEEATPKVGVVTAVQPSTCKFELQIGIPDVAACPDVGHGLSDATQVLLSNRLPAQTPRCASARDGVEPASHLNRKATVYAWWEDRVGLDLNQTLAAVRSETRDQVVTGGGCLYDRWWRTETGWERRTNGKWGEGTCTSGKTWVKARNNAHFANSRFPTCVPGTVHVYYDTLWVKVTTTNAAFPAGYQYGMRDTWAEGDNCRRLLEFAGFAWYPEEYWRF